MRYDLVVVDADESQLHNGILNIRFMIIFGNQNGIGLVQWRNGTLLMLKFILLFILSDKNNIICILHIICIMPNHLQYFYGS